MTLQEYYDALKAHDWDYERCDVHSVYMKGAHEAHELRLAATLSARHASLWRRFNAWKDKKQKQMPARPV